MVEARQRLTVEDFDFDLPPALVAQHPAPERAQSRLLRLANSALSDHVFKDLLELLRAEDVLVLNDTRVMKARLDGVKESGGCVELLIERVLDRSEALVQIKASRAPSPGTKLRLAHAFDAEVVGRRNDLFYVRFGGGLSVLELLEHHGAVPLPPYITRAADAEDAARYQTVYARTLGAVAAPTAGLHFDAPLLDALRRNGVELAFLTLHVGAGTFQPVRVRDIATHRMHSEWYNIPPATAAAVQRARDRGASVIAVGTTALRALEAATRAGSVVAGCGETDLFITPGYSFRVVDRLITNFHLPKSTLLMLVSAFAGIEPVRKAYRHAIREQYRFFSYGDAMFIDRA
jgi:S-adenosylmethionine:tRNA ribosyltransferase-isomerase